MEITSSSAAVVVLKEASGEMARGGGVSSSAAAAASKEASGEMARGGNSIGNGPDTGDKGIGNAPDTGDKSIGNGPDTGDKSIGNGPDTGDKSIGNGPDTGDNSIGNGPDTGDKSIGNAPDTGDKSIGNGPDTGDKSIGGESDSVRLSEGIAERWGTMIAGMLQKQKDIWHTAAATGLWILFDGDTTEDEEPEERWDGGVHEDGYLRVRLRGGGGKRKRPEDAALSQVIREVSALQSMEAWIELFEALDEVQRKNLMEALHHKTNCRKAATILGCVPSAARLMEHVRASEYLLRQARDAVAGYMATLDVNILKRVLYGTQRFIDGRKSKGSNESEVVKDENELVTAMQNLDAVF